MHKNSVYRFFFLRAINSRICRLCPPCRAQPFLSGGMFPEPFQTGMQFWRQNALSRLPKWQRQRKMLEATGTQVLMQQGGTCGNQRKERATASGRVLQLTAGQQVLQTLQKWQRWRSWVVMKLCKANSVWNPTGGSGFSTE